MAEFSKHSLCPSGLQCKVERAIPRALPRQPSLPTSARGMSAPPNLLPSGDCDDPIDHHALKLISFGKTVVRIGPDDEMIEQVEFHEMAGRI